MQPCFPCSLNPSYTRFLLASRVSQTLPYLKLSLTHFSWLTSTLATGFSLNVISFQMHSLTDPILIRSPPFPLRTLFSFPSQNLKQILFTGYSLSTSYSRSTHLSSATVKKQEGWFTDSKRPTHSLQSQFNPQALPKNKLPPTTMDYMTE